MNRRDILKLSTAGLSLLTIPSISVANSSNTKNKKKFIWILLRGGMDGLHTTIPTFEPQLMALRSDLVKPIKASALPLKRNFLLHPELTFMHKLFESKQLNAVVATATHYRKRSHFAAQDILESGLPKADVDNGWLARVLIELNANKLKQNEQMNALAIARSLPPALRGDSTAMTWYPSLLPDTNDDLHQRLLELYQDDQELSLRLTQALETQNLVGSIDELKQKGNFSSLAKSCAAFMTEDGGPAVAMLEMGGWDTHHHQVNILNKRFSTLDKGIKSLHAGLGKQWKDTVFVISTEFGRTVKINGTGGTDHGTATSMFIGGGAIDGGQVLGKWPGLEKANLRQGRDLMPTSNTFDWIGKTLQDHWQLSGKQISRIFPS